MDVFYAYTYATAAWLTTEALALIVSPSMIVTLLSPEVRNPSTLEVYFSQQSGLALLTIALLTLLVSGSVPLTNSGLDPSAQSDPTAPYLIPTLAITGLFHAAFGFLTYTMYTGSGSFPFFIATCTSAGMFGIALWCVLFGSSNGKISRKTGADKRVSNFPFKNVEAEKRKGK